MKEQPTQRRCLWCNQKIKEAGEHLHRSKHEDTKSRCEKAYYDRAEKALRKAGLEEYPEMNVIERSHLKKIKICRSCKFPITEEEIRKIKLDVEKRSLRGMKGLCKSCIKIREGIERKPHRREEEDDKSKH